MSDDLSIQSQTYRVPHQRRLDPTLRRVMIYAGGLVAAGLVVGGVSLLFNRQSSGPVPVVQADPRPLRVKPDNPGGMQIAGLRADRSGEAEQPGKLAPAPETPDPGSMRAGPAVNQARPAETPDIVAPRVGAPAVAKPQAEAPIASAPHSARPAVAAAPQARVSTPPAPTPVPTTTSPAAARTATALVAPPGVRAVPAPTPVALSAPATHLVATNLVAPNLVAPNLAAPGSKAAAPAGKTVSVQLAALLTEEAARNEWQQMERRMPELLDNRRPGFSKFERDGRTYWRVRVAGFGDVQQAKTFCERVRAKNASCSVADF